MRCVLDSLNRERVCNFLLMITGNLDPILSILEIHVPYRRFSADNGTPPRFLSKFGGVRFGIDR